MEVFNSEFLLKLKKNYPLLITMAETMHEMMLLLNDSGELVYFNKQFSDFAGENELMPQTGVKPGVVFRCINAMSDAGCGRTALCRYCGAAAAINEAVLGKPAIEDCKVVSLNGRAFDLKVSAKTIPMFDSEYIMYCVKDTSAENRKSALEKIFFHDINNIVWGMNMMVDTLVSAYSEGDNESIKTTLPLLESSVANLTNEIKSNLLLSLAEKNELDPKPTNVNVKEMMTDVIRLFREITSDRGITFKADAEHACESFVTDEAILKRVVINMIKNAVEASSEGDVITAGCEKTYIGLRIHVRNPAVMPENIKASVFKRAQSTKGAGRGLGTYSMRLLTERYLQGRIYFTSEDGQGTVFYAEIPQMDV